jgi:membrane-associated protease RseP (regulator of RpoE activity)
MRHSIRPWFFKFGSAALAALVCCSGGSLYAQRFGGDASFLFAAEQSEGRGTAVAYWIGVACEPLPSALRAQLNLPQGEGVLLEDVIEDGPAAKAGLKQFDVLLSIDDELVGSQQDVARIVVDSQGKKMTVRYLRGGKEATVAIEPAKRPSRFEFGDWVVPEGDQASLQNWLERLRPGMPPNPLAMRFFHPGMVLPPDAGLPDDMSVTIAKHGKEPAKISVKRGEQSWEVSEDKLDELPDDVRLPVERMLGRVRPGVSLSPERVAPRAWRDFRRPEAEVGPSNETDRRLEQQMDELREQLRQLQQAVEKLEPKTPAEK